ncbi:MAG TPA: hypothetical protein VFO07_19255 [Roseiflexaceae bacterium]|nr:hypothetical protein [Roseiflexaceae bacterium]
MARQLRALGFDAAALKGGYNEWRDKYPVESKLPIATLHSAGDTGDGSPNSAAPEPQPVSSTGDRDAV